MGYVVGWIIRLAGMAGFGMSAATAAVIAWTAVAGVVLWYRAALVADGERKGIERCQQAQQAANERETARQQEANSRIVVGKDATIKGLQDEVNRLNEERINASATLPEAPTVDKNCPPSGLSTDRARRLNSVR